MIYRKARELPGWMIQEQPYHNDAWLKSICSVNLKKLNRTGDVTQWCCTSSASVSFSVLPLVPRKEKERKKEEEERQKNKNNKESKCPGGNKSDFLLPYLGTFALWRRYQGQRA